jgi:tetratricopeptide (TPR) repeat protein
MNTASLLGAICLAISFANPTSIYLQPVAAQDVRSEPAKLRLAGKLDEAIEMVEQSLAKPDLSADQEVLLRVELARIHDRISLHWNTRPSVAALRELERAQVLADHLSQAVRAALEAQWAVYYYRAETQGRDFVQATLRARRARELFVAIGDKHGEADTVHQMGLFHFQKRELESAQKLFDESLELDKAGGSREFFLGEYHRHVGYLIYFAGNIDEAIPNFEKSLAYRMRVGAIEPALFAATTLGTVLVEAGRLDEADKHLCEALVIAERLNSPVGISRVMVAIGQLHEARNDLAQAASAYRRALAAAEPVNYTSIANYAREALVRLGAERSGALE